MSCGSRDFPLDTWARLAKVAALDNDTAQACSSVGEHYLDTVGVGGSIPPMPTNRVGSRPASLAAHLRGRGPSQGSHLDAAERGNGKSRALLGLECYPAQPLSLSALSLVKLAPPAMGSVCVRSECHTRE